MSFYQTPSQPATFADAFAPFVQAEGLPFAEVLPADDIQKVFDDEGVSFGTSPKALFTPSLIIWAFLSQVLGKESCRATMFRVLTLSIALGRGPCSTDTAAYCRARAKLPAKILQRLTLQVGRQLEEAVPVDWLWKGKHVQLLDGFTVTLPDTPENQEAYPQPKSQKPGLGFPMIRMVVVIALVTATIQGMAFGPYQGKETGEPALFRQLLDDVPKGTVLLADRYFCSYFMVALALKRGIDVVFRLHQKRKVDFRRGERLGRNDHVVVWFKPARPKWMDAETYAAMPATLRVREVRTVIDQPGFRIKKLVVMTTLTDATEYASEELTDLYHERWHVELDIRSLKQYMGMDQLRCKTPFMVEKEIWTHLLGYNLVRKVGAQAAWEKGLSPRQISFTATVQAVLGGWDDQTKGTKEERLALGQALLQALGKEEVGDRPNRCEPREVKRRPKPYPRLKKPRAEAKAKLLARKNRDAKRESLS